MKACRVCGGATEFAVEATERMFGLGGQFRYDQCRACGCVQLRDVPADLERYYASDYYAFADPAPASRWRRLYRRSRDAVLFGRARALGGFLAPILPSHFTGIRQWLSITGTSRRARILDVGCAAGLLLRRLVDQGFDRAAGVDLFVGEDIAYRGRRLVQKATIHDVPGPYDLIMFHHSLEHIQDQLATMMRAAELLAPGGWCLIRIPTVSSFAWEEYRDRWVQLDAPRHLYLHSLESLARLATRAGLRLERVVFDSTAFQFMGSELYARDRPLAELDSTAFSRVQQLEYSRDARRLNRESRGDQAAFYLRKG